MIASFPKIPARLIQDPELILGKAGLHEIQIKVAVPLDGNLYNATRDGEPIGDADNLM